MRQKIRYSLVELAVEVKSASNGLQSRETVDVLELAVVGDQKTTADGPELGEGDVGELAVGDKGKGVGDVSEVGRRNLREEVAVETQRSIGGLERLDVDAGAVEEVHLVTPDQVRQSDNQLGTIGLEGELLGYVGKLEVDLVQEAVVGNHERLDGLQVDALEGAEEGVLDGDAQGGLDLRGEGELGQIRQAFPNDPANIGQAGHIQVRQDGEVRQGERSIDHLQVGSL